MTADELRKTLKMKDVWLESILVTRSELKEFLTKWANAPQRDARSACDLFPGSCPLSPENKNNESKMADHGCPLNPRMTNRELKNDVLDRSRAYYKCWCIYDAFHAFFNGGIEDTRERVRAQNWEKVNGRDLSEFFTDDREVKFLKKIRFNDVFSPIEVEGWPEGFAFVARFWGDDTIEKLKNALDMGKYVTSSRASAEGLQALSFNISDCRATNA